ncbi:MAG TPA: hypothetical protein VMP08_10180 [Anaerolineae bacterium]|nr:hypothetical protein [Anaerolineae bacterium]
MFRLMLRCLLVVAIGLTTLIEWVKAAPNTPGDLDLSFGGFGAGGEVISPINGSASDVILQSDGKIVVIGNSGASWFIMRYLPNGTLDSTFSGDGIAIFSNALYGLRANAVALQSDGKIVVAGQIFTSPSDFMLARVTPSGVLDTSFGNGGYVTTDFDSDGDEANAILIQPDGKIVAAGAALVGNDDDFAAARYTANGALDDTFSGDGKVTIGLAGFTGYDDVSFGIARQTDGKLVLAGASYRGTFVLDYDFALARLNSDGTLDSSFDGDGKVTSDFGGDELGSAVFIQPDGKIVVVGDNHCECEGGYGDKVIVVRYNPNGSLDNSFDGDGEQSINSLSGEIYDSALQPDGRMLILGYHTSPDNDTKMAFYRLNSDGSLDTTFDGDGEAFFDLGGADTGRVLVLQPDGRILGYGSTDGKPVLIRLWPDATLDTGGQQALGFADPLFGLGSDEIAYGLAVQSDGKVVIAGEVANPNDTESDMGLARFLPNGQLDTSFGDQGRVWFGFGQYNVAQAIALQPDGKIIVAGYSDPAGSVASNFLVARYNPDGALDSTFSLLGFNLIDFAGGDDYGRALALAPDGKIVVAGEIWNGSRYVYGVARLLDDGALDTSFDGDGKATFDWVPTNWASAVVVQPDRKIIVGGHMALDFALVRFNENGSVDSTFGSLGATLTDMGGSDDLKALLLAPDGWLYAAGIRDLGSGGDFALAQYQPNGVLASCAFQPCTVWADGKRFVDWGGADGAYALDWRDDGRIVAAGCAGGQFAWAQLRTNGLPGVIKSTTDFVGSGECAYGVKFAGANEVILVGSQQFNDDRNMALARFETTVNPNVPVFNIFLPSVMR